MNRNHKATRTNRSPRHVLDNDAEFNANQFKLYDDFTTDLRIGFNTLQNIHDVMRNEFRRRDFDDSGVDLENGNIRDGDLLENEVMLDPWSSMDSSNSPLTDSGPSASDDCVPSTSSESRRPLNDYSPESPDTRRNLDSKVPNSKQATSDKARSRDFSLELDTIQSNTRARRSNFLDDEFQLQSKTNLECPIPKPHFLDHSPSPDEYDECSDITNPNFLDDDDVDDNQTQKKAGALPKRPTNKTQSSTYKSHENRPHGTSYRSSLHYGLESAARSSERHKRASQLYTGTWPGERDVWTGHDSSSVKSFSSNGSNDCSRPSSNLENKMECVCSLISLLSLSPENNADLSGPLLDMSRSVESCIAMRQAGCIPLLVQLIHSKVARETRDRAAKALRNIIHTQTDDKSGRREARVWRLLEQVREYCYVLEDIVEARKENKELIEDDTTKHPSQSVAALMKLSFDEEHRHVVCQLGGLQALAALVSGDQAAHGSRTDDSTCLTMRKYAGMTLTNLTFGDGNNKSLLCSFKDFMLALVEQLESPNDDMRQVTAAVLRNLSWRADTNSKQVLREVGAVKGLTKAAMTCQKEATLKSVLSALWNLTAHCSMNKVALCSVEGALGFLVDMLSYNSPTKTLAIVENAGGIMRNVSSHIAVREDYRQILRERNCLSVLLQHLKSPSLTVVSNSCGTLWNLSARCPQDQQFLWDHGAVPMLRSLIHSKHKMIAMGSSAALKNLLNSKPGKTHIISLDTTAKNMNLPALPTLGARKQKALEQELDQNLAETCDNIEPATSPSTSNREEKNLFVATERQIAMNLERHRMTSSSPLMGNLASQISLSHSAHLSSYLSCSNTLLKGALISRSTGGSSNNVNRSDSKDSVTSTHSDSVFERVMRTGKVPVPTPRNKDLMKAENAEGSKPLRVNSSTFVTYATQPPIPPPRSSTDMRTNYTESGYDVDQDSCDQPIDYSRKYSETKNNEVESVGKAKVESKKYSKKDTFGDYQETDLDQPTDYSLRYAEHHSETGSDISEPPGPSINEDTIKHFATEGTPYETPVIFSTATSMSDLRVIGKEGKPKTTSVKEHSEVMTHSDEKDTCSIEDPPRHDNDRAIGSEPTDKSEEKQGLFDTKFSSGMISPEKPVNYCDEGTPGYFSRVSSLSSLGEPTEEDCLAKKNAQATINVDPSPQEQSTNGSVKDKEASKAVTFASEPVQQESSGQTSARTSSPQRFIEDTPLMFSRTSSLGSLPECSQQDDQGSVVSEISRLTSGCISPSEIPDSPGMSPRAPDRPCPETPPSPPEDLGRTRSVFEDQPSQFVVENTPAHFSRATSLSSLTINDDSKSLQLAEEFSPEAVNSPPTTDTRRRVMGCTSTQPPLRIANDFSFTENQSTGDSCRVYFTEDTPAILSKAGSNSNLSVLSIESNTPAAIDPLADESAGRDSHADVSVDAHDTSDSSNLSDSADLLEECIQKGIAQVVKNSAGFDEQPQHYLGRDDGYRAMHVRASSASVKPQERATHADSRAPVVLPSLPPKTPPRAPPRPPYTRPQFEAHSPSVLRHKPKLPVTSSLARNDSLSSLSLDSFGSTDQEIFEETVKAGLSSVNPQAKFNFNNKHEGTRRHKSLDRSDKIPQYKSKVKDPEFERNLASGVYNIKQSGQVKRLDQEFNRYGEPSSSLRNRSRFDDGPPSLPSRMDRNLDRSSSLSSISNDSFGSTDKEVFERCVRMGMAKPKKRDEKRVRSDDRLDVRDRRRKKERQSALDKMVGEDSKDRAILEEVIAKGAGEGREFQEKPSKNVPAPPVLLAVAGARADIARETGSDHHNMASDPRTTTGSDLQDTIGASHDIMATNQGITGSGQYNNDVQDTTKANFEDISTNQQNLNSDDLDVRNSGHPELLNQHAISNEPLTTASDLPGQCFIATRSKPHITISFDQHLDCQPKLLESSNHHLNTTNASTERERAIDGSNECLAPKSLNTTIESEKDELNRSNESYAEVDNSWSDESHQECGGTLTRNKRKPAWTDIKRDEQDTSRHDDLSHHDTWNDTCPDDVTFPTISGSVHLVESISEMADSTLPDLLEKSEANVFSRLDLTDRLDVVGDQVLLDDVPEPSFNSLIDEEQKYDSIMASVIEKEAARLAAQLKLSMENSATSLTSIDLDQVNPPSNLGSLLSLSASGQFDDQPKKSPRSRKKSLPVSLMVKRALSNSHHQGSSEHLDSNQASFLDNVKPPSEMEHLDMEGSMTSVASISSEVAESKEKALIVFDLKQPVHDFPLSTNFTIFHDLDKVNPPSLFDEMVESTLELEQTTAQQVYDDCESTLNVVTDIPSGSDCTPLPSDMSSVESTPKRQNMKYLTPKEKRNISNRYQTYTIRDTVTNVSTDVEESEYLTWTKSESDRSDEYVTANSESRSKKRVSAKQRRLDDRARYQTQTVDIHILTQDSQTTTPDPEIESLKQRLAAKKTIKQKRIEDAERFRTRTLSEDIPPSPTFVTKDANFENIETTTGYDSLSSNEPNHQQILDDRSTEDVFRDIDSGHTDDDFELNSDRLKTYTKSFRNYLPVVESPAAVDMCVVNNLKNIEMTASYRRALQNYKNKNPSSSDFASYEGDSNSEEKLQSESDTETPCVPKPKIVKPELKRDKSLDSNDSEDKNIEIPKVIRGRKKAAYVSPYRRNQPATKKIAVPTPAKATPKPSAKPSTLPKSSVTSKAKTPPKPASANSSPKKSLPNKSPIKVQRAIPVPPPASKPLPLVRQGTFTKEESSVPPEDLPIPDTKVTANPGGPISPVKTAANTSPSRLPQFSRTRPPMAKTSTNQTKQNKTTKRNSVPMMKNSPSNHSLQSNDSGKTIVLARGSRHGSTSSVNSTTSKTNVESKIANLWKKVEHTKKLPAKNDQKPSGKEPPKLIRSSTFEGQPKQNQVTTAAKQKTAIGIKVSQIPSLRPKSTPSAKTANTSPKKTIVRSFLKKPGGPIIS
ncbi:unnamed protein product [Leptidea sinapis]|uniref:Adenomatous polyposis coli protein n=1 Tax=Leptidea sinapis TaxID=189913 RepID=A0A5E4R5P1_9NEOP|nr:unnamed protein product [Leptidea sinapis]